MREAGCSFVNDVDEDKFNNLSLYPNPTTDQIFIEATGINAKDVLVYDAMGNRISVNVEQSVEQISIDMSNTPAGIYFVNINNNSHRFIKK